MKLEMEAIRKGVEVMGRVADGLMKNPAKEFAISYGDFLAIAEGFSASIHNTEALLKIIGDADEKEKESKEILSFISSHQDGFKALMRRCGIW